VLYNGLLSGVSLTGDRFFYPNPLASMGQHQRGAWFSCACCISNMARFLPSVPGYVYAQNNNELVREPVHEQYCYDPLAGG